MVQAQCVCGSSLELTPDGVGTLCPQCSKTSCCVGAEDAAAPDLQAYLVVETGPDRVGERIFLSGLDPINVGKLPANALFLPGKMLSRHHCTMIPLGDHQWGVEDNKSTNGLFINQNKVGTQQLKEGDLLSVGEYELRFHGPGETPAETGAGFELLPLPPPPVETTEAKPEKPGPICPHCNQQLKSGAKICVSCGIDLKTGKPLVISRGVDENILYHNVQIASYWASWVLPLGIFPIASEAYGKFKPTAMRAIVILTIIISVAVWIAIHYSEYGEYGSTRNLMMWSGTKPNPRLILAAYEHKDAASKAFHEKLAELSRASANSNPLAMTKPPNVDHIPNWDQLKAIFAQMEKSEEDNAVAAYDKLPPEFKKLGEFHWYQLLTNAFLHGGIIHLAGNMIFLIVFGNRINALVGQVQAAALYLILAVLASTSFLISQMGQPMIPALGASGAIMGMAGMYFILMPVSRVHMVVWIRPALFLVVLFPVMILYIRAIFILAIFLGPVAFAMYRLIFLRKTWTFSVRGYWVLLFFIAFDVWATIRGAHDGTAHWAHLGGFICGIFIALGMLLTRRVNAHGADMISLIIGAKAWKFLGTPEERLATA
jgi:membrane associated rhomboid family serine protease